MPLGATGSRSAMLDRVRVSGAQPETEGCLPDKHPTGGRCQTSRQARDRRCRRGVRDARRVQAPSPARRSSPPPLLPPAGPAPPAPSERSARADGRRRLHPPGRPSDDDRGPARPAPPRHRGPGRAAPTDPQTGRDWYELARLAADALKARTQGVRRADRLAPAPGHAPRVVQFGVWRCPGSSAALHDRGPVADLVGAGPVVRRPLHRRTQRPGHRPPGFPRRSLGPSASRCRWLQVVVMRPEPAGWLGRRGCDASRFGLLRGLCLVARVGRCPAGSGVDGGPSWGGFVWVVGDGAHRGHVTS